MATLGNQQRNWMLGGQKSGVRIGPSKTGERIRALTPEKRKLRSQVFLAQSKYRMPRGVPQESAQIAPHSKSGKDLSQTRLATQGTSLLQSPIRLSRV